MDNVEAIIFDVFGTVVDWHGSVTAELVALGQKHSFPETRDDWASFATEWRQGYLSNTLRISQGGDGTTNVDQLHRELLDSMLKSTRWGHIGDRLNEEERTRLNLVWHRLNGWPDTVEGLYTLKKHAIIASLSNGNVRLLIDMAKHANLPWDAVFSSELFGRYKPAPEAYLGALKNLSLTETPEKCVMVAAHMWDLRGAATHGIKTVYISRGDDKSEVGEVRAKKDGGEVDCVVNSFLELAKLFEHQN